MMSLTLVPILENQNKFPFIIVFCFVFVVFCLFCLFGHAAYLARS